MRDIFVRLVQVARRDEGAKDAKRRIPLHELGAQTVTLVEQLADARLLVTSRNPQSGEETVEVAHEALIGGWDRLRSWLDEDRAFLLWRQRLRTLASLWDDSERNQGVLLRDALLKEAQVLANGRRDDLSELELAFMQESEHAVERAEQAKEASRQRELEQARELAAEQQRRAEAERQRVRTKRKQPSG